MNKVWGTHEDQHDHLSHEEKHDVDDAATAAMPFVDMSRYEDAWMIWHRGEYSGRPQVFIWPMKGSPLQ